GLLAAREMIYSQPQSNMAPINSSPTSIAASFPHAMRREIYEQPQAIAKTIEQHLKDDILFPGELETIESALLTFEKLIIAASGSSRHAGLAGEIMIEDLSGVAVDVEYASEYCYRSTHAAVDPIVMVVTQSGETADTIAAQREALTRGVKTIAVSNVADATIPREASAALITGAGPELSVPATKSFTTQVTVLYLMALFLARRRGRMTSEVTRSYLQRLRQLPEGIESNLRIWDELAEQFAHRHFRAEKFLYLGRGVHYAIAREGALKLKEISYAHAEGYPAGELKHGPNALVDEKLPVVMLATYDQRDPDSVLRYRRTLDVMKEVKSRRGQLVVVATEGDTEVGDVADDVFFVPPAPELLLPIVEVIPLQLFAYHVATKKGYDVDRPRNLVKAVVTE
ncbi:MAG TPA: isomerizing glutamine--fructose-6-phosphate transaminase, partial [Candidatus Sulfotelmatobacter sp.]|nr:isomerizing glutamine--fructose-6-phosphate transaminase [Candidatus Sulfotelmatobacter sp.]